MNQHHNQSSSTSGYTENISGYYPPNFVQEDKPINWKKYLFIFISNWYWFLIAMGIALAIVFFKIRYTIPQYEATSTLIIEEDEGTQDLMNEIRSIRYMRRRADMANEVAKLRSYTLIERTTKKLDQEIYWTAFGRIREKPLFSNPRLAIEFLDDSVNWYQNQIWFIDIIDEERFRLYQDDGIDTILRFNQKQNFNNWQFLIKNIPNVKGYNTYSFVANSAELLTKAYRSKLQIETDEKEGTIITLRSRGIVGERECDFLNALCTSYIKSGLERKQQIAGNTFLFIDQQIELILDSLQQSEDQMLNFRLSNNVINLSREGDLAYEQLKGFSERKTQLRLKENYYLYLEKYVDERNDPQTIISPTVADANDELLIGAVQKLQQLYEERENLDFSVSSNNPSIESINVRIRSIRLRILEIIDGLKDNNSLILEQINTEEHAVVNQLKSLPINEQQLLNIKRKYDLYNQFYTFLLQKRAEAGIQKASTISNARILDPARYDHIVLVGSNEKVMLIVALLSGLLLPAIFLLMRDILDNKIREREDITNQTKIPIIGIIGHSSEGARITVKEYMHSPFTESLRRIRTNMQFLLRDPKQKVILITSSISGEGKTFTATNLAAIFALNNKKTLLVGCDLRRPTLHRLFQIDNNTGLSSIIIGKVDIDDCIIETATPNLFLLPAGPVPPNPAELLETKEVQYIFSTLKEKYDYIILDTPPVALVSDALSLSDYADSTLYVIRQNYSHSDVINIVNQMDSENRLPMIGLIINDIKPSKSMGLNYYYGYNQGYNYGYYEYSNYNTKE